MTETALSQTHLLAFVRTPESAEAIHTLMQQRGIDAYHVETGDIATATAYLAAHPSPAWLVVEVPPPPAATAALDALAETVHPHCKVVATGSTDTLRFYQWLLGLGLVDYLLAPFTPEQLAAAFDKASAGAAGTAPDLAVPTAVKKHVAVIGARGGVGATTIATNLAAICADAQQLPVTLADLDPYFGNVALGLDLEPGRGLREALEKPERVDGLFLDRVMLRPSPGLGILSAEEALHEPMEMHEAAGQALFGALAARGGLLLLDLPRQMHALTRYVLRHADVVLLVAEPHVIDLRDALRIKDYLCDQLQRPAPQLVLNRVGIAGKYGLPVAEFARHFGAAPVAEMPWLPEAYASSAEGTLLSRQPRAAAALAPLRALATALTGAPPPAAAVSRNPMAALLAALKKPS